MIIHKNTFICSVIISILAVISYSVFGYSYNFNNPWAENISLAIFGSAILVVITSLIGYHSEKRRLQEKITDSSCALCLSDYILEEGLQLSPRALARLANITHNNFKVIHGELKEYYLGCFFKDEDLKRLINEELIPYAQKIDAFRVAVAEITGHPKDNTKSLIEQFNDLWNTEKEISNHIENWIVTKVLLLGKEFCIEQEQQNG